MYQHICQATQASAASQTVPRFHPSLLQAIYSDELFTNAKDNHRDANRPFLQVPSALSHPMSRRQVVHGATALKNTSATKLKHYRSRHMVNSCTSWEDFFTFPTRDLGNDENAWLAHKHEQDPLLRVSWQANCNHGTFLRWAATWHEDTKEQELHQAWTMKTHKTVILLQI